MTDVNKAWDRFLLDRESARNYQKVSALFGARAVPRNPLLENILPSLLYVRMAAILDEALAEHFVAKGIRPPKKYHRTLGGRLLYCADQNLLANADELKRIAKRRNELAHEPDARADWAELDGDLGIVCSSLQEFGLAGPIPKLEFFGIRDAAEESDEPGILLTHRYRWGVKRDGVVAVRTEVMTKLHDD